MKNITAILVIADSRANAGMSAQRVGVIGEVSRRASKLRAVGQQIRQHLAYADYFEAHTWLYSIPSCFCICSKGIPLVSGTIVFTQINCSTIMKAKNENT